MSTTIHIPDSSVITITKVVADGAISTRLATSGPIHIESGELRLTLSEGILEVEDLEGRKRTIQLDDLDESPQVPAELQPVRVVAEHQQLPIYTGNFTSFEAAKMVIENLRKMNYVVQIIPTTQNNHTNT